LRAAAGEPLPITQGEVRCDGHAIEVRVYAEDPAHGFLPSTGTLHRLQLPHDRARVETGVAAGAVITPHYDPMIAKLITHAADRAGALAAIRDALAATRIAGVACNLGFVEGLLRSSAVVDRIADTGTIDRLLRDAPLAAPAWRAAAPHALAAWALRAERSDDVTRPASTWAALTHWRLGAAPGYRPLQPQYELHGDAGVLRATVGTLSGEPARYRVAIGALEHEIEFGIADDSDTVRVSVDGTSFTLWIGRDGDRLWIGDGRHTEAMRIGPALHAERRGQAGAAAALVAPLTGKVLEVRVADGDAVEAGEVLLVIESMKMEMRITAPHAGVARGIDAAVGATVERGAVLARVVALETAA
ncbi:MAG TPA: biotin/lipoyl-containing protein, partial [Burkholderiaceae bacterium]|nr:biotin/lipoyl-containing protein [Burkholderiaceae bacterium]